MSRNIGETLGTHTDFRYEVVGLLVRIEISRRGQRIHTKPYNKIQGYTIMLFI